VLQRIKRPFFGKPFPSSRQHIALLYADLVGNPDFELFPFHK
jgi:hypothetical protein